MRKWAGQQGDAAADAAGQGHRLFTMALGVRWRQACEAQQDALAAARTAALGG